MNSAQQTTVSNERIVDAYDRLAIPYDWLVAPFGTAIRHRAIEHFVSESAQHVLEIGCGPGHALELLARHSSPGSHVIGLDAAPGMLERARRNVDRATHATDLDLVLGDARSLPIPDASLDVVFVEDTLELFSSEELSTIVAECGRVLKPDGRLGVLTMERSGVEDDPFVRIYEWLYEHLPGYGRVGCRPIYARNALEEGGFEVLHRERHRRGFVWPVALFIARPT